MKKLLKSHFPEIFAFFKVVHLLALNRESYLYTSGYFQSVVLGKPSDCDGNDVPWMNYPVIQMLEKKLNKNMKLFEYGSGSSTLFFAKRVESVVACEHDTNWSERIMSLAPDNVKIVYKKEDTDGDYCRSIGEENMLFDVVVVDGRDRPNCVNQAVEKLTASGVIVLDDSHRDGYQHLFNWMQKRGFRDITIAGLKPLMKKCHSTTIFYRSENCFGF